MELDGRTAVVTGAAGGIGLGIAKAALDRGMQVMIADLDGVRAEEQAAALAGDGGRIEARGCDVRDLGAVEALRDDALRTFGRLDLVANNAGVGLARPLEECRPADWDLLLDVNVRGVTNGVRAFLPHFIEQGWGHVTATASLSGLVADPDLAVYNLTKFAVVGLLEALAQEMRRDHPGVTASVLCPGPVATELMDTSAKVLADGGSGSDDHNEAVGEYLARGMHPDDVGRLAVDGIAAGRFWLLPHPDLTFELLEARMAGMRDGGRLADIAEEWTDQ